MDVDGPEGEHVEDMWKVIERFGIKRELYEMHNPTYQEVRNLYLAIAEKQGLVEKME